MAPLSNPAKICITLIVQSVILSFSLVIGVHLYSLFIYSNPFQIAQQTPLDITLYLIEATFNLVGPILIGFTVLHLLKNQFTTLIHSHRPNE